MGEFRFRQFSLRDDRSAMKIGTDAVLLGAWANVEGVASILDIGTGCGIIALMLAQRTTPEVAIHGIEIQTEDAAQARENIRQSPWPSRIEIHDGAVQAFHPAKEFDLIVSNPPFYSDSLLPPDGSRKHARHHVSLGYEELLASASRLINLKGRLDVILPYADQSRFNDLAVGYGFSMSRLTTFYTRKEKPPERCLMEFSKRPVESISDELVLYAEGDQWTSGYQQLTGEFYLPRRIS